MSQCKPADPATGLRPTEDLHAASAAEGGVERRIARLILIAALTLIGSEVLGIAMQAAVLMSTVQLSLDNVLHAHFAEIGVVKIIATAVLAAGLAAYCITPASAGCGTGRCCSSHWRFFC